MTLEKTKEIYIEYETKMYDIKNKTRAADPKEAENVLAVELALRGDMIFHKYGVEENELQAAVKYYKLDENPVETLINTAKEVKKEISKGCQN